MALIFNNFARNADGNTTGGIIAVLRYWYNSNGMTIRIYPTTVAYPSTASRVAASGPGGYLGSCAPTPQQSGASLIAGGTTSFNPSVTGTASWAMIYQSASPSACFFTDSVGLPGTGKIISLSTMDLVALQAVTVALTLKA